MKIGRLACICLLLASLLALLLSSPVLAQDEKEETIELEPTYRTLEDTAPGARFEFEVKLNYQGDNPRDFNLSATGPKDWSISIKPAYGEQMIRSIRLEPDKQFPDSVKVAATPPFFSMPEPGEYQITLETTSGDITGTVDLTAIITATYSLNLTTTTQRLNTTATAGKDNYFSIEIQNAGSGTLENVKFSSRKPDGWTIEFQPEKIDTLSAGSYPTTVDVNIKPAAKAIAGDYEITLTADTTQTVEDIRIRVTVETPTVWGWVGIGIILVVIAGVTAVFMRFSRR